MSRRSDSCGSEYNEVYCDRIKLHFKDSKGNLIKTVEANEGDDILSIAHEHDIDLEGESFSQSDPFSSTLR